MSMPDSDRPNILVIWGDDIGITNRAPDVPNLFVSDGGVMNTEAAANAALTAVAPGRPHRGAPESGTVLPAIDLGAGPTVFLCLTEETVMLASSTIGCC
jgi:hypothetical protein